MEENRNALFNLSRVCRFCLSQSGVMSPIFNQTEPSLPCIATKIMAFSRVQLFCNDGLPSVLCHRCLYLAEKCFEFKTQCEASDSMLRKYLSMVQAALPGQVCSEEESTSKEPSSFIPVTSTSSYDPPLKRKRGRPRKEENLIFYSSPPPLNKPNTTEQLNTDQIKIMDGVPADVTVVDPRSDTVSNSDEEVKKEHVEVVEREPLDSETMRSLAAARAKAKKYMGVITGVDENGQKTRRHLCKGCGKTFGHCSDLRKHVLVHTGERPFHCQLCDKTFSRSTNLNKHLKVHTGQKPYSCTDCPKSFASKGDLQRHLVIHSGIKPFSCHLCQQCFSRKDKLTRHVKLHDDPLSVRVNSSKTGWTGHSIGVTDYDNDLDAWHTSGPHYGGEACDEDDNSSEEIVDLESAAHETGHVESMIINIDPFSVDGEAKDVQRIGGDQCLENGNEDDKKDDEEFLNCPQCPKMFMDSSELASHLLTHTTDKPHKCSICPKSFARRRELIRHETVHTGLKPFECLTCHKAFSRKDKLARHKKIHGDPPQQQKLFCKLCSMEFFKDSMFQEHMACHTGDNFESGDEQQPSNGCQDSADGLSEDEFDENAS